jgi:hypothetical protein
MKTILLTLGILILVGITAPAKSQIIITIAGDGNENFSGDSGLASLAEFVDPNQITFDHSGNLYISDESRIRKIDAATGIITTIAGIGSTIYSGDNGLATDAGMYVAGVAVDDSGNVFFADFTNQRIRKISSITGIITTIAGTGIQGYAGDGSFAVDARLSLPLNLIFDHNGDLLFTDYTNNVVRKITMSTGIITTIAGDGYAAWDGDGGPADQAELNLPYDLTMDAAGNIFITDEGNACIRKIDASTGYISTIAGVLTNGYSGDGGPAIDAAFNGPKGIEHDSYGNLYIVDCLNQRVRKIDAATGIISTCAGHGIAGFGGDGGPATSAKINYADGIAFDSVGCMYIGDLGNNRLRKIISPAGVGEFYDNYTSAVFPNPSNGNVTISLLGNGYQSIIIRDAAGKQIKHIAINETTMNQKLLIDLNDEANGFYFAEIIRGNGIENKKIVISH